jgi:hypothetical protein
MTTKSEYAKVSLIVLLLSTYTFAQSAWTDGESDQIWSSPGNWSGGVPTSSTNVQIGTQPTDNEIGLDTDVTINSLQFNASLTSSVLISPFGSQTLTVTSGITNLDDNTHSLGLPVIVNGNSAWSGTLIFANNITLGANTVTVNNNVTFTGAFLNITLNSASFGNFTGPGSINFTATEQKISVLLGTYIPTAGDTFTLLGSGFTGATVGELELPSLGPLLSWNVTNFESLGQISVVPEPATVVSLAGLVALGFGALRRRRREILKG